MAAKSPISPTIVKYPEGSPDDPTSPVSGVDKQSPANGTDEQVNEPTVNRGTLGRRSAPLPSSFLTIQPTPYYHIPHPLLSPSPLAAPNNERSYLVENLQRQHQRGERLSHALANVEDRLPAAQNKTEARKLRKEAGLLKTKIAESRKQEQMIMLRLNDIQNEDFNGAGLFQAQSAGLVPYAMLWSPYSSIQPWSPMTMPMMSPVDPVSPLTPLPPGIYHPSPIVPSPMASPFWMGHQQQYPVLNSFAPNDPSLYLGASFQPPYVPEGAMAGPSRRASVAPPVVRSKDPRGQHKATKSVDFALPAYTGRRWSLADAFSPTPKDKRMSIPGLQTIWKGRKEEEDKRASMPGLQTI